MRLIWANLIGRIFLAVTAGMAVLTLVMVLVGQAAINTGGQVAFMTNQHMTGTDDSLIYGWLSEVLEERRTTTAPPPQAVANQDTWDIVLMDIPRGVMHPITNGALDERYPAWSPDGTQIAYHANPDRLDYDLYIMDDDGRNSRPLNMGDLRDYHEEAMMSWEPNGDAVIFHAGTRGGNFTLYVGDVASGDYYELPDLPVDAIHGDWSPDGTRLAFTGRHLLDPNDYERPTEVYVLEFNAESLTGAPANVQRLTGETITQAYFPAWSPDGEQLAFVVSTPGYLYDDIFVMNADGSNLRNLTENSGAVNTHPEWLPDGRIMFASDRDGDYDLYVMNADGSNLRQLTDFPGDEQAPDWRPGT